MNAHQYLFFSVFFLFFLSLCMCVCVCLGEAECLKIDDLVRRAILRALCA